MLNIIRKYLPVLLIPAFFAIGLYLGPKVIAAYHAVFPPAQYVTGDHDALLAKAGNDVVMYATTTCQYCAKVRTLLAEEGVKYTEYQIDKSEAANMEFTAKGGIGVPLLYIGDRRIDGFREPAIRDALKAIGRSGKATGASP
ncbi:MAG: glutaredoxin family protein [Lysobacter sp.]|nr:glutaredoxin family protein [Lysobacter sp.]